MSNQTKNQQRGSVVTTTETARSKSDTRLDVLSPQEEKVLRMLHGLSEEDSHELKFALGADEETRLKLAMMERDLHEALAPTAELAAGELDDGGDA
ncbi:hypothetical protein DL240_09875 [Lujinxingia litoralis]|uniref:Uncharacterized protein n=1 Tax=Lujinxingia litoralis TaxID=2211119 RepID=A0A328C6R4_9DELT|nr:hypothetical protein [Lujinxingia litoralis]RAL22154.1 hypothetical protein DL240_09875 [Lujinxingia litoralis]